jgi:lysine-N-methylase
VDRFQKLQSHKQTHQTQDVIMKFRNSEFEPAIFLSGPMRDYSENMVKLLLPVDSESYMTFSEEASKGDFEMGEAIYNAYFSERRHMLDNYFVNLMVKNLFPFTEADQVWDAFMMLFTRFAIIKVQLIGIAGFRGELTDETVVAYIQSFSKVIEHHRTFVEMAVAYQKKNGASKLSFIGTAL